ncbi:MAG: hypothetical protein J6T72_02500 [Alphaproteobacteria bacterium]|nr:hypothetical protein [Alphaproteobacteria bacterium]
MADIWQERKKQNAIRAHKKASAKNNIIKIALALLILHLLFPQYIKRIIYPILFGTQSNISMQISKTDNFQDISAAPIEIKKGRFSYLLLPKVEYSVTGRVGYVDTYNGIWNKFYRGFSQQKYITLVPRDIFLVIGDMAKPEIFSMFKFEHEERGGSVLCKGVKYRKSFMSSYKSQEEAAESQKNYEHCHPYIKQKELNNYHPIAANKKIDLGLSTLLPNDILYMEGYLVDVPQMGLSTGTRKEQTHSNMIMNGYNPGKCFILYTTKVIINGIVYE